VHISRATDFISLFWAEKETTTTRLATGTPQLFFDYYSRSFHANLAIGFTLANK
jgi:hypothetical protein